MLEVDAAVLNPHGDGSKTQRVDPRLLRTVLDLLVSNKLVPPKSDVCWFITYIYDIYI